MVLNIMLFNIYKRLKEIFVIFNFRLFVGISIIVVGDFY